MLDLLARSLFTASRSNRAVTSQRHRHDPHNRTVLAWELRRYTTPLGRPDIGLSDRRK